MYEWRIKIMPNSHSIFFKKSKILIIKKIIMFLLFSISNKRNYKLKLIYFINILINKSSIKIKII